MADPRPLGDHFPDADLLELADRAWDAINLILDSLVQRTGCSNAALQDLLLHVRHDWDTEAHLRCLLRIREGRHG